MHQHNPSHGTDLSLDQLNAPQRASLPVLSLLRKPSQDLAYMLGAWSATTEVGSPQQRLLSFCSLEKRTLEPLKSVLSRLWDARIAPASTEVNGSPAYRIRLLCPALSTHIHSVTGNNSRVPWEHLGTRLELVAFLRGVFDNGGWISNSSSPGVGINKVGGTRLLEDIGQVCFSLGLLPLICDGGLPSLRFRDHRDILKFYETVGFSRRADKAQLAQLCRRQPQRRSFEAEEYETVLRLSNHDKLSPSSIAARTAVPANTVRDWVLRGQVPRAVLRHRHLSNAREALGDPAVISLMFREFGASPEDARACAKIFSVDQARAAFAARFNAPD